MGKYLVLLFCLLAVVSGGMAQSKRAPETEKRLAEPVGPPFLLMPGWRYDVRPQNDPFGTRFSRLVFRLTVNHLGEVTEVQLAEGQAAVDVQNWYREEIQKTTFSRVTKAVDAREGATGTLTFVYKSPTGGVLPDVTDADPFTTASGEPLVPDNWTALDEKNGFRKMVLGTPLRKYKDLVLVQDQGDYQVYRHPAESLSIRDIPLQAISYGFYKGQLAAITLQAENPGHGRRLLQVFQEQYGAGAALPAGQSIRHVWKGAQVTMYFTGNNAIMIFSNALAKAVAAGD